MAISRIEQLIEDIYEFIESCKMQPLSSTKVIVPKDELYDLLDELRLRTPDEIKRYQKIIANREAIIKDAEEKGKAIVENADNRALSMIDEHEIMQQAYEQANDMVNEANNQANNTVNQANSQAERILAEANYEANQIMTSSLAYTEELLSSVEAIVYNTYVQANRDYEVLTNDLKNTLDLIKDNKSELAGPDESYEEETDQHDSKDHNEEDHDEEQDYSEDKLDDFDFDEEDFLKDLD